MRVVDDTIETIHLYVVREEEKRPYTVFPLLCALLCVVSIVTITVFSAQHPSYEHATLTVPAQFLPLQTFKTSQAIVPTGIQTYPATISQGTLTVTNGSIISQTLPAGFTSVSGSGFSVVTDRAVFVPAGSADGYGIATVSAHLLT